MNERRIFLEALARTDSLERDAYLDKVCAQDPSLRQRITRLLDSHQLADQFLEQPPPGLVATIDAASDEGALDELDFLSPSSQPGSLGRLAQYEVVELVGRGGMGIVLRAYDPKLNRVVAIKVLAPQWTANSLAVKRFLREAQAAAAIRHDHVVTIHGIHDDHSPPMIVMEFIDGISIQERIEACGALELDEIIRIGVQAAEGLAAAHAQGLVHRDIKPANILLENGVGRVKLSDFGLARAVDDVSTTQVGQIAGTPEFMSPEQAQGLNVDHRSDLFSLGSVLYMMCAGRSPFRAASTVATLKRVSEEAPRRVCEINPDIPEWFEEILARLLEKDADQRFQSADEVAERLRRHVALSPAGTSAASGQTVASARRFHVFGSHQKPRPLSSVWAWFMAICALFVIGSAGMVAAMAEEIEAAFVMLPILGLVVLVVSGLSWHIRRSWLGVVYGISASALMVFAMTVIANLDLRPSGGDEVVLYVLLLAYTLATIPTGLFVMVQVLLDPADRWPQRLQFDLRHVLIGVAVAAVAMLAMRFAVRLQPGISKAFGAALFVITVCTTCACCFYIVRILAERQKLKNVHEWRRALLAFTAGILLLAFGLTELYFRSTNYGYVSFQSPVNTLTIERRRPNGRVERRYDTRGGTQWHVPAGEWEFWIQGMPEEYRLEHRRMKVRRGERIKLRILSRDDE